MSAYRRTPCASATIIGLCRWRLIPLLLVAVWGCGPIETSGDAVATQVFEDPVPVPWDESHRPEEVSWLGEHCSGSVVRFSGRDGRVVAEGGHASAAERSIVDLAFGFTDRRAVVVERGRAAEGDDAQVLAYPLGDDAGGFGAPRWLGRAAVSAQVVSLPSGVALFDTGPVPTWQLLTSDGESGSKQHMPSPVALWRRPDSSAFEAAVLLRVDDDVRLRWLRVRVHQGRFELASETQLAPRWPTTGGVPRLAPHPQGVVAAGVVSDTLRLVVHGRDGAELWRHHTHVEGGRLVAIVRLAPTPRSDETYAVLLADPTRLVRMQLDGSLVTHRIDLPGDIPAGGARLQRRLVVDGDRLWAATTQGVYAVASSHDGQGLELDAAFDGRQLRGPIAGPVLSPSR